MPILVFLLWRPAPVDYAITFVLYCIVGITDYFDGYLARAWGSISQLGQFLDPIADKIMVAAMLVMLISSRKANPVPEIAGLNLIPALVILLREIIVSGLREYLAGLQISVPVSALAKWKTTLQLVALGALILGGALPHQPWVHMVGHRMPVGCRGADPDHRLRLSARRPEAHGEDSVIDSAVLTDEGINRLLSISLLR